MKNKKQRKRNKRLSLSERIQIELKYSQGRNLGEIAKHLGKDRNKSTISREIGGRPRKGVGKYQAYRANPEFVI
jgi:IS30 family transposase